MLNLTALTSFQRGSYQLMLHHGNGFVQVCMLVSTYEQHGLRLTALITSLLASGYPNMDIILLDTDTKLNSSAWLHATAEFINTHSDLNATRDVVHISERTQRCIKDLFPEVIGPDFGYDSYTRVHTVAHLHVQLYANYLYFA
jgi:hypothetical protein